MSGLWPSRRAWMIAAPAALALAVLTALVVAARGVPFAVDAAVHDGALEHRTAGTLDAAKLLTDTGTGVVPYTLAAVAGWIACRRARAVVASVAVLALGQLVRVTLRYAVDRPRPPLADRVTDSAGPAFPSGHATTSALAAGLLAWALLRVTPPLAGRLAAVCCALWAAGVAATRIVLGVHWPTDIIGGWLLATCWLVLTLPVLGTFTDRLLSTPPDRVTGTGAGRGAGGGRGTGAGQRTDPADRSDAHSAADGP
ncbi:phosphatase PAP2 family protein [Streptomyces cinnamoneus]|uniref:Phosphatase PAP2 family protein n=1 Tax=Streptomyces cinnamoneus TaxID=53446 RepID=A0A918WET5_STRCJ|nr:phosphatase PAP2 family protein [Streptomyces cinnamoneus]GHC34253.1 phosphatase PAP2 family protein [Streptomyces cinnamoneus]